MSDPVAVRRAWLTGFAVASLLLLHVALALGAVSHESVTSDEILHLTGGYFYDRFGDYRIHPENGNLPQRWAALPAVLAGAPAPELKDNIYWNLSDASVVGHQFFYETNHDHWPMLMAGRAMISIFSVGTGLLIFAWARRLWGDAGGLLALAFYALDPNVLAHAALATSDTTAVFFLLAACGAFWRHLQNPQWRNGVLSAAVFGLACVAKYSAVLLLPIFAALLLWAGARRPAAERARWWPRVVLSVGGHGVAAVAIIWLFFGFRYTGFSADLPPAAHYIVPWDQVLPAIGWHGRVVQVARDWHLLPEAFLFGYAWVIQSAMVRACFIAGEYGIHGWVKFFPLAFLWKTPLALLGALALGLVTVATRWNRMPRRVGGDLGVVAPLVALFVVYAAFSLTSHLNIGHRHILPLYPVLFILAGGLAAPGVFAGAWRRIVPVALVASLALANASVAPHYLAFFNRLAGGPANGWHLLVDSSLDWGQDLPGLRDWLATHAPGPRDRVYVSYFGSGNPDYYQINATKLPFLNGFKRIHPWYEMRGGTYAISATMLQEVYSSARGEWTAEREREYQQLRARIPFFREYFGNPLVRAEVDATGRAPEFHRKWQRFDLLRFARLCHYLRAKGPDAMIGYSILIFRVTDEEISTVIDRSYSEWAGAVAAAREKS